MAVKSIDLGRVVGAPGERGPGTNPNLLHNWYFPSPINQRGKKEYTSGYTIDRWFIASDGSGKVTLASDGVELAKASGVWFDLRQKIEALDTSMQYTLSIMTKDGVYFATSPVGEPHIGPVNFSGGQVWLNNETGMFQVLLRVIDSVTKIIAVKLELGDTQTLARQDESGNWVLNDPPPDPTLELLKCQRYYIQTPFGDAADINDYSSAYMMTGSLLEQESQYGMPLVKFPVKMRANPAVRIYGYWSGRAEYLDSNSRYELYQAKTVMQSSQTGFVLTLDEDIEGNNYRLFFGYIADAEL